MLSRSLVVALVVSTPTVGCVPQTKQQIHAGCRLEAEKRYPGVYRDISIVERQARDTTTHLCMRAAGYEWTGGEPLCTPHYAGFPWADCYRATSISARLSDAVHSFIGGS